MVTGLSGIAVISAFMHTSFASWGLIRAVWEPIQAAGAILCRIDLDGIATALNRRVKKWGVLVAAIVLVFCLAHEFIYLESYRAMLQIQARAAYRPGSVYLAASRMCQFGGIAPNLGCLIFYVSRRRILGRAMAGVHHAEPFSGVSIRENASLRDGG
jgi:hypothetical protein